MGLDLATTLRKKVLLFLINKACHVRWPCVTRGAQSDSSFYLPPRSRLDSFSQIDLTFRRFLAEFWAVCSGRVQDKLWKFKLTGLCSFVIPLGRLRWSCLLWCHHLATADAATPERSDRSPQGMTSSRHEALQVRWPARLCDVTTAHCDVIAHAPMTGSLVCRCHRRHVRYLTVVARGWRLVRLAASALWPCR